MSLGNGKDPVSVAVVLCGPGTDQNHEITAAACRGALVQVLARGG